MKLRSTYRGFTEAVDSFFDELIQKVLPHQVLSKICFDWRSQRYLLPQKTQVPPIFTAKIYNTQLLEIVTFYKAGK